MNALVFGDYVRAGVRWYLKELGAMMRYPMLERVAECSAVVAVIRGERDQIARESWCSRLAAASGGPAELVSIPRGRHVIQRTATAEITRELVRLAEGAERRLPDSAPTR